VVLLIHGASGSQADLMLPLGDRLAAHGFRVLAFDRPGLGWSELPADSTSVGLTRQAELLRAATEKLGAERAIVVAHSLAGAIGAHLAIDHPTFVAALVLLSPVTHPWPGGVSWYYRAAAAPVLGWWFTRLIALPAGLAEMDRALRSVFEPRPTPSHYAVLTGARMILTAGRFRANAEDVLLLRRLVKALAPRLPLIRAPTAIVTGDPDGVVSARLHSFSSARVIPDATLTVLPDVGHSPHWAEPEAVANVVAMVAGRAAAQDNAALLFIAERKSAF
jgi:pimeloyl-ACP methyl ester carboxylesterase